MVKISVDEAYAYDMLAIYYIKFNKDSSPRNTSNVIALETELSSALGIRHADIMRSKEFAALQEVNFEVFERIDLLKSRGEQLGDAKYIDDKTYARYLAKKALQEEFFPEQEVSETKLGYQ